PQAELAKGTPEPHARRGRYRRAKAAAASFVRSMKASPLTSMMTLPVARDSRPGSFGRRSRTPLSSRSAGPRRARAFWRQHIVRLSAAPSFQMPVFAGSDGAVVEAREPERLHVAFFDTDDLRLARWGASLRHLTGRGWTLELPVTSGRAPFTRDEYAFPGGATTPPTGALDVVRAFVRTASLKPVARLRTVRRAVDVE